MSDYFIFFHFSKFLTQLTITEWLLLRLTFSRLNLRLPSVYFEIIVVIFLDVILALSSPYLILLATHEKKVQFHDNCFKLSFQWRSKLWCWKYRKYAKFVERVKIIYCLCAGWGLKRKSLITGLPSSKIFGWLCTTSLTVDYWSAPRLDQEWEKNQTLFLLAVKLECCVIRNNI